MSQNRAQLDKGANNVQAAQNGDIVMSQMTINNVTVVGASTLSVAHVLGGIINRTGPTAGYTDTFPSALELLQACPQLAVGDSFELIIINTVAFANTVAAGAGIVLGANTAIAASSVREYLLTVLATGFTQVAAGATVNTSPLISGLSTADAAQLTAGMGVAGTGIPGGATVTGVNASAGTVTISANATATNQFTALTFTPRIRLDGVRSSTL